MVAVACCEFGRLRNAEHSAGRFLILACDKKDEKQSAVADKPDGIEAGVGGHPADR
jgi:hypothetical protein